MAKMDRMPDRVDYKWTSGTVPIFVSAKMGPSSLTLSGKLTAVAAGLAATLTLLAGLGRMAVASSPSSPRQAFGSTSEATTSDAARRDAMRSIPFDKLSPKARAKIDAVLSNVTLFRRMPVRVVDCDPDFYLFLVRHPDVVVNIWELFKISQLKLRESGDGRYCVDETAGTTASVAFVYASRDVHVIYGEGEYQGPLLARPAKGRGVLVLKTGYVREANGRCYIASRLDSFLSIEPLGAELVTKTVSPLLGKTIDNNFVQTVAFIGSLSRTAEVNSRGVQRLAGKLTHVEPDVRHKFAELAAAMPKKPAKPSVEKTPVAESASRLGERLER